MNMRLDGDLGSSSLAYRIHQVLALDNEEEFVVLLLPESGRGYEWIQALNVATASGV